LPTNALLGLGTEGLDPVGRGISDGVGDALGGPRDGGARDGGADGADGEAGASEDAHAPIRTDATISARSLDDKRM
jgi:hypothetical protein